LFEDVWVDRTIKTLLYCDIPLLTILVCKQGGLSKSSVLPPVPDDKQRLWTLVIESTNSHFAGKENSSTTGQVLRVFRHGGRASESPKMSVDTYGISCGDFNKTERVSRPDLPCSPSLVLTPGLFVT
jgi:hypothetical protein